MNARGEFCSLIATCLEFLSLLFTLANNMTGINLSVPSTSTRTLHSCYSACFALPHLNQSYRMIFSVANEMLDHGSNQEEPCKIALGLPGPECHKMLFQALILLHKISDPLLSSPKLRYKPAIGVPFTVTDCKLGQNSVSNTTGKVSHS
jgi:hypothetical protein